MEQINMTLYGMTERFRAFAAAYPTLVAGRVISQEKGCYRVVTAYGEGLGEISGKLRYETRNNSDFPAVGDFVMLSYNDDERRGVIHHVLPRKSAFIRKAAGTANSEQVVAVNIDTLFICMSLNNDFNPRRLERYLSIAWDGGAIPVVVLTKADLCENINQLRFEAEAVASGAEILVISCLEEDGFSILKRYILPGTTAALIGSSGVGKSTLINCLLGENRIRTNGLRGDDRGRHTTTHRELIRLPDGGIVIDTPGMRELGLWDSSEGVERAFADIEELSALCHFKDCMHNGEPGCAVAGAIDSGELSSERFRSYMKLKAENDYSENSALYLVEKERKFKRISMANKSSRK